MQVLWTGKQRKDLSRADPEMGELMEEMGAKKMTGVPGLWPPKARGVNGAANQANLLTLSSTGHNGRAAPAGALGVVKTGRHTLGCSLVPELRSPPCWSAATWTLFSSERWRRCCLLLAPHEPVWSSRQSSGQEAHTASTQQHLHSPILQTSLQARIPPCLYPEVANCIVHTLPLN